MKHLSPYCTKLMARVMIFSTLCSTIIILLGTLWYLSAHSDGYPKHQIFLGEPQYFTNPITMVQKACSFYSEGERRSIIMIGIFILLVNPILRVLLAAIGYAIGKNILYFFISALILAILMASFL